MAISQTAAPSQAAPTGLIIIWAATTAPQGWLLCNGAAVSRTLYVNLFNIISTTYGSGDGSSTFNVPDLRAKLAIGKSGANSLGQTSKGVTADASPANTNNISLDHSHSGNTGGSSSDHSHNQFYNKNNGAWSGGISANHYHGFTTGGVSVNHTHGLQSHTHTMPDIVINYIIKA